MSKKWPPLDPGTVVETTQPNLEEKRQWTEEGWARKKWCVRGPIITHHDSHGLCYDVQHPDGTVGCYDPSEFEIINEKNLMFYKILNNRSIKYVLRFVLYFIIGFLIGYLIKKQ